MQVGRLPEDAQPHIGRDDKAEIVDRLYEVALDPIRLEDLLEVWEGHVSPHRSDTLGAVVTLEDPEIEAHLRRAAVFLDRFEATREDAVLRSVLEDIPRSAAFLSDGGAGIAAFNSPAEMAFGLKSGAVLADLPFHPEDIAELRNQIARTAAGKVHEGQTLRLRSVRTDSPVILRISAAPGGNNSRPLALVVSTELVWPPGFEATVQDTFGLTVAEVEIVRGIALGQPLRDIAEARGRSLETVRTQLRSILSKTETHSQSELVRVVLGLMDLVALATETAPEGNRALGVVPLPYHNLITTGGRRLQWIEYGDPQGAPVLYMPINYHLLRLPATAERALAKRGIRVVAPVRAGYGRSDPPPPGPRYLDAVVSDYLAVLDHLRISKCAVLAFGADLRFALGLSLARPGLVTSILGCAAQLPTKTAEQYQRMHKWHRFVQANARFAPKVLPFVIKAGFAFARRIGKEKFLKQVNAGSPYDIEVFARAEVRAAILAGSEVSLSDTFSAYEAFTRESVDSDKDWSHLVTNVQVPVELLQGDQDPQSPVATLREQSLLYPHLKITLLPNCGQLLLFGEWPLVLDRLEAMVPR